MSLPHECPFCYANQEQQTVITSHIYGGEGRGHSFFYLNGTISLVSDCQQSTFFWNKMKRFYNNNKQPLQPITINAFMIAGGILFFRSSIDMIEAKVPRSSSTPKETEEAEEKEDISII